MSSPVTVRPAAAPSRQPASHRVMLGATAGAFAAVAPDSLFVYVALIVMLLLAGTGIPALSGIARALGLLAVLLASPPLIMMTLPASASTAGRIAALLGAIWLVVSLRQDKVPSRWQADAAAVGWPLLVVLVGGLAIVNSYVLWGPAGPVSVLEHRHVDHAGVIVTIAQRAEWGSLWPAEMANELRSLAAALPLAVGVWVTRGGLAPAAQGDGLVAITAVASAGAMVLAWVALAAGTLIAASSLRSRLAMRWSSFGLVSVLVGPLLMLRVAGLWPEAVAAAACLLAAVLLADPSSRDSETAILIRMQAVPLLLLAFVAWPPAAVVGVVAILAWATAARGQGRAASQWTAVVSLVAACVTAGAAWAISATHAPAPESFGAGLLGGVDWRLAIAVIVVGRALIAVPAMGRPSSGTARVLAAVFLAGTLACCGIAFDYLLSVSSGWNGPGLAALCGLLALASGLPTMIGWLATGDRHARGWHLRSWRTVAGLATTSGLLVWTPWADGVRSVVPLPGLSEWSQSAVSRDVMADQRATDSHRILECGWDALVEWPSPSSRAGAIRASSAWAAAMSGRTDGRAWGALPYVYPPFGVAPTPDDQFVWLRTSGESEVPRRILWVLPDDVALAVAARVPAESVPAGITLRPVGRERFGEELAQCAARNEDVQ